MVSFLSNKRQCAIALTVVVLIMLVGLLPSANPVLAQENTVAGEWEFDVAVYQGLRSDGSTYEENVHITIVAQLSEAEGGFTGSYVDAFASSANYNACTEAEISGSIQGDQVTWTVHYTGSCCLDAEMLFQGTLSQDKNTMTGSLSPVSNPPSNCELWWANVTGTKAAAPESDTGPPTVSWVKPLGNGGVYPVISGTVETIELEASVTDNVGIELVEFRLWDGVSPELTRIATFSVPPYQVSAEVNTLHMKWNHIFADVTDTAGTEP